MIGLEMNLNKLKESGKSLITTGVFQFILCAAMGFGFFLLLGFTIGKPLNTGFSASRSWATRLLGWPCVWPSAAPPSW